MVSRFGDRSPPWSLQIICRVDPGPHPNHYRRSRSGSVPLTGLGVPRRGATGDYRGCGSPFTPFKSWQRRRARLVAPIPPPVHHRLVSASPAGQPCYVSGLPLSGPLVTERAWPPCMSARLARFCWHTTTPVLGGESLYLPPIRSQPPRLSSPGPDCRHGPRRSLPCPNAPTRPAIRVLPHLKLLLTVIGCSDSVHPPPDLALPGSQLHGRLASVTLPSERFAPLPCAAALTSPWAARRRQRPTSLTSQGHACQGEH